MSAGREGTQTVTGRRPPTSFESRVYDALKEIPRGKVVTYASLANYLNCGSAQAVGQALKRNPLAPAVPCHRVIRTDGFLGGYSGESAGERVARGDEVLTVDGQNDLKVSFEKLSFEESVKLNPKYLESHRSLSRLSKYKTNNDEHFIQLREIYKKTSNDDLENKSSIAFALAKAYEDISDYDKSFTFYKEANTLYRKKVTFSIIQEEENFKEIKDTFSKKLYEKYLNTGNLKNSPIFIIGMPRSGTTLIEQILSNHPKVFGADEIEFIPDLVKKNFRDNKLTLYFNNIINFDQKILKEIGDEYISKINNISENSERSTDKLTTNFLFIGLIKLILPKSKIVHCYRNSRDNCLSIFKNHFPSGKINYAYSLDEIVKYYNLYYDLMDYWRKLLPNFIFDIKYENLISNTKNEINDLLEFCNLNWSDSCLNFYENKRPIKTASHIQARSKIYKTSVDSWKKYEKNLSDHFKKLIN